VEEGKMNNSESMKLSTLEYLWQYIKYC